MNINSSNCQSYTVSILGNGSYDIGQIFIYVYYNNKNNLRLINKHPIQGEYNKVLNVTSGKRFNGNVDLQLGCTQALETQTALVGYRGEKDKTYPFTHSLFHSFVQTFNLSFIHSTFISY